MFPPAASLSLAQESLKQSIYNKGHVYDVNDDENDADFTSLLLAKNNITERSELEHSILYLHHAKQRSTRDLLIRQQFASMSFATMQGGVDSRCYVVGDERLYNGPINSLIAHDDLTQVPIEVLYERNYLMNMQRMKTGGDC